TRTGCGRGRRGRRAAWHARRAPRRSRRRWPGPALPRSWGPLRAGRPRAYSRTAVKEYYHRRAPEYDDWYRGAFYGGVERETFLAERAELEQAIGRLPTKRTLDVACGTGFLTRHLRGEVAGCAQSPAMLQIARGQAPGADYVEGDAFDLPFPDGAFERVFTGHFYGHLEPEDRRAFLAEARRVAPELVVADAARRPGHDPDEW